MADKDGPASDLELVMHYIGVILAVAVVFLGITYRPGTDVAAKTQRTASIARVQDNRSGAIHFCRAHVVRIYPAAITPPHIGAAQDKAAHGWRSRGHHACRGPSR